MKKCSICRKLVKNIIRCWILREVWHGYRTNPDYKVTKFVTKALCLRCLCRKFINYLPMIVDSNKKDADRAYKIQIRRTP